MANTGRFSRTRRIVDAIQRGFRKARNNAHAKTIEVKNNNHVKSMDDLLNSSQVTFVLIKANWCGHCNDYVPKWQKIQNTPTRNANMVTIPVELQKESQVLKNVSIEGIPTVLEVRNGVARSVDLDEANDEDLMAQEVSRPSNIPIPISTSIETIMPVRTQIPTPLMETLVEKLEPNPRDLGETDGSRVNQPALDLALPAEEEEIQEDEIQDLTSVAPAPETSSPPSEPVPLETGPLVDMTAPQAIEDVFIQEAEKVNTLMNEEAKEQEENIIEPKMRSLTSQRGGAVKRNKSRNTSSRKKTKKSQRATLLKFLQDHNSSKKKTRKRRRIRVSTPLVLEL